MILTFKVKERELIFSLNVFFFFVLPELSTEDEQRDEEGDDEEGSSSSDEFTDSIEEDDSKVTARSLPAVQVWSELYCFSCFCFVSPLDLLFCLFVF